MPILHVNDLDLWYDTQGDPSHPAILLIVGLGMQAVSWPESFCNELVQRGFYLIRFDNRDNGLSTKLHHLGKPNTLLAVLKLAFRMKLKAGYTLDDMASDAVGVLDALGISKAHIVGASMGGMIAQIVAARYPERTLSLTSIMSTSGRRGLPGPTRAARKVLFGTPPDPLNHEGVIQHFVRTMQVIGSPAYPTPAEHLRERVERTVKRSLDPTATTRQLLAIGASGDRVALLQTIKAPTLVIHGTSDPLVPIAGGRDVARLVPHAVLHEIEGMGHDMPDQLNPQLAALIGEHCHQQEESLAKVPA
ncbi:alpha/beta fold hydrolase [Oxalicibacterium faecigallinarum]|uniref:Hydrolase n=1 Tax=Oxalicibacterium faecigallinarum TaxID=573741 RepID=A0A8J3AMV7_9BURK|nr:alpha/beta hydrolase [Oxalicibacterium faecigallinarum]GGI16705.1 hydrolase [Oxalicibacterium faecigallinarum]